MDAGYQKTKATLVFRSSSEAWTVQQDFIFFLFVILAKVLGTNMGEGWESTCPGVDAESGIVTGSPAMMLIKLVIKTRRQHFPWLVCKHFLNLF